MEAGILSSAHTLQKISDCIENQPHEWERRHQAFHTAIASGCQSPTLLQVRRWLYEKASRYRNLWLNKNMTGPEIFAKNQQQHQDLITALLQRDIQLAKQLTAEHLLSPSLQLGKHHSLK